MSAQLVTELTILVLAAFVGFEVISKVPTLLHTPLMSGTNAIHGIVIVGAIIVMGTPHPGSSCGSCRSSPSCSASANVVGGFVVTDRMLEMFKKREPATSRRVSSRPPRNLLYLFTIVGVHPRAALPLLAAPRAARRADRRRRDALSRSIATLSLEQVVTRLLVDGRSGWRSARRSGRRARGR